MCLMDRNQLKDFENFCKLKKKLPQINRIKIEKKIEPLKMNVKKDEAKIKKNSNQPKRPNIKKAPNKKKEDAKLEDFVFEEPVFDEPKPKKNDDFWNFYQSNT